ncbi:MAG TPA: RNA polymerase sporulation sigma factor SigK [Firmicutes bacterium]|mgnify:CR=1 FL=1|jgi:RNA polymerase sporulation-specific sigma factor|nr:RNA polymerase sporulation sigma factor SigK [Bacillota bacterium]
MVFRPRFRLGALLFVSHVSGGTFPQPLEPEEEERLIRKLVEGDEEARKTLIERNLRLVAHIVKKYSEIGEDNEDLISIGTIGLIKGVNTFDPEKSSRLATYVARCIENEILMYFRAAKKTKLVQHLYDPIGSDKEGNELSLIDVIPSDELVLEEVEDRLEKQKLYEKLSYLTPREKLILRLRYGLSDGIRYTQREIAKHLGISRSYVSRIEMERTQCANLLF